MGQEQGLTAGDSQTNHHENGRLLEFDQYLWSRLKPDHLDLLKDKTRSEFDPQRLKFISLYRMIGHNQADAQTVRMLAISNATDFGLRDGARMLHYQKYLPRSEVGQTMAIVLAGALLEHVNDGGLYMPYLILHQSMWKMGFHSLTKTVRTDNYCYLPSLVAVL
ncbi:MAG: hypothetical protein ABIH87_03660 [bacterium]